MNRKDWRAQQDSNLRLLVRAARLITLQALQSITGRNP